jgi:hypothetical protein
MRFWLISILAVTLSGCAQIHMHLAQEDPIPLKPRENLLAKLPELDGSPMTVAV